MKKLVTVMNTIIIRKLTVVPAILGITALIISACSAGGGGGGSSEGGSSTITSSKSIQLGDGQYSGRYLFVPKYTQYGTCTDGYSTYSDTGYFLTDSYTVSISQSGNRLEVHNIDTGEVTMTGTVYGSNFNLSPTAEMSSSTNSGGTKVNGTMSGTFYSSSWSGDFVITGTDSGAQCTFTIPFSGSKEGYSTSRQINEELERYSNSSSLPEGTTKLFDETFGVLSEADSQSEN
jgi:hypothetical protein